MLIILSTPSNVVRVLHIRWARVILVFVEHRAYFERNKLKRLGESLKDDDPPFSSINIFSRDPSGQISIDYDEPIQPLRK